MHHRRAVRWSTLWLAALAGGALASPVAASEKEEESAAALAGFSSERLARVDSAIEAGIRAGATPGAALAVGRNGVFVRLRGYGRLGWSLEDAAVSDSTLYDIASLTKAVGTTTAVMILVDRRRIDLDTPIHHYLPIWPVSGAHARITLRHLLTHTSGLPAGANLWTTPGRSEKLERIARLSLVSAPGVQTSYSDLGMIVVAGVVESVTGERLDDFLHREVFEPMGMRETVFNPVREPRHAAWQQLAESARSLLMPSASSAFFEPFRLLASWIAGQKPIFDVVPETPLSDFSLARIAPTAFSKQRGRALQGVVHDPIAASMGGVAGHAGLFSSVRDLAVFAQALLDAVRGRDLPILSAQTVTLFTRPGSKGERALGWDVPSGESSSGNHFSKSSFGHTGFTGTSIWIDPERDLFVVLLTNRVHPSAENQKHVALRRAVHDAVQIAVRPIPVVARHISF